MHKLLFESWIFIATWIEVCDYVEGGRSADMDTKKDGCLEAGRFLLWYSFGSSTTWTEVLLTKKFDPTGVWTHDLQIMTVHFMSLRCLR